MMTYLVICEGCWAIGPTEDKARRTCQLIYGRKKLKSYIVYETDDETVEVSPSGNILRDKASDHLEIIRRVKDGVEVVPKAKEPETKTEVIIKEEPLQSAVQKVEEKLKMEQAETNAVSSAENEGLSWPTKGETT